MHKHFLCTQPKSTRYILLFSFPILLLFQGCSGFSHLTAVDRQAGTGPGATDCGSCHVDQFREWHGSAHNLAYSDPLFRKATDNYEDESCLACHIPENIRSDELTPRHYSLAEGITCTSCHLDANAMHGPHDSSALITPHPVKADPAFYTSSGLCGVCHEETFSTWEKSVSAHKDNTPLPQCQECHMAKVTRTSTRGTNMFSKLLVSFEDTHEVRSHTIDLATLTNFPGAVRIDTTRAPYNQLQIRITNQLPHNLPGGEYTESSLMLVLLPKHTVNMPLPPSATLLVSDTDNPLQPGGSKRFTLSQDSFGKPLHQGTSYSLQLVLKQTGRATALQLARTTTGKVQ